MPGSLNDILPEPISPQNEAVLLERSTRAGSMHSGAIRAFESTTPSDDETQLADG